MYSVEIINKGGSVFNVKSKDYEFSIDTRGDGVAPPDALLASLGSCVGVYVRKYAEGAKLDLDGFIVKVEAEFVKDQPVCFKSINISVDLKETKLDEKRKKSLIAFIKNCPVHNTLKANPDLNIEVL